MQDNTSGTLNIQNNFGEGALLLSVSSDNINCCDQPTAGEEFSVQPNEPYALTVLKTSGHGCNGNQGQFSLDVILSDTAIAQISFSFDSDANINITNQTGKCEGVFTPSPEGGGLLVLVQAQTNTATATATATSK